MSLCEVIFTSTSNKRLLDFVIHTDNINALATKFWKNNVKYYELTIVT
jgi:hypothetical protein